MEFHFHKIYNLYYSMQNNKVSIEQFSFTYNNVCIDCILDISTKPFELMIGILNHSWACIIQLKKGFSTIPMDNKHYYELLRILRLEPSNYPFTSFRFFKIIDDNIPQFCSGKQVKPSSLAFYRRNRLTEDERKEGYIFCGWLTHEGKNNGHARNFNKTEQLLGKDIADFCREHDISSKWTTDLTKEQPIIFPLP